MRNQELATARAGVYGAIEIESAAKVAYDRVSEATEGIQARHAEAAAALAQVISRPSPHVRAAKLGLLALSTLWVWQAKGAGEQQQLDMVNSVLETAPPDSVELVIHIGCSLGELGIVVGDFGNIKEAPSGLFDKGYSVLAVDGKRFKPALRDQVLPTAHLSAYAPFLTRAHPSAGGRARRNSTVHRRAGRVTLPAPPARLPLSEARA